MRSHVLQSAIAPTQKYVCPSCRYQIIRGFIPAKPRYQHNGTLPKGDQKATSSEPALANLGSFLPDGGSKQPKKISLREPSDSDKSTKVGSESSISKEPDGHGLQQKLPGIFEAKLRSQTQVSFDKARSPKLAPVKDEEPAKKVNATPSHNTILGKLEKIFAQLRGQKDTQIPSDVNPDSTKALPVKGDYPRTPKALEASAQEHNSGKNNDVVNTNTEQTSKDLESAAPDISAKIPKQPRALTTVTKKKSVKSKKKHKAKSENDPRTPKMVVDQDGKKDEMVQPGKARKVPSKKVRKVTPKVVRKYASDSPIKVRKHPRAGALEDDKESTIRPPRTTGVSKSSSSKIEMICSSDLHITPVGIKQPPVPSLAHGLEKVLFNQGVYQLQDPRSRVYNFDPYLQKLMPIADFDFNALREYITSSKDQSLQTIGKGQGKRYVGSTSSMSAVLAHFHFLLSQWRPINISMLSKGFPETSSLNFTELQRTPQAIFLRQKDGCYAIDADKQFDSSNVLSMLGRSMEKLLTLDIQDFEKYRRSNSDAASESETIAPESYHYSTFGDFLMRSQLDAHDPRLPGTGMFDLKTRAVVSIRMDVENYEQGSGYEIKTPQGEFESYEREYHDMIRAAFLKYSMQVRMGRMDGIFVAFHNVERIFGFQYISLAEMDNTIHGQWDTSIGDQEFKLSLNLLNKVLDRATKKYPNTSIRIHFETRDAATPFMYIFAEPVTEEQVTAVQNTNLAKVQEFERRVLGRDLGQDQGPKWEDIHANMEKTMEEDELGLDEGEASAEARDDLNHLSVIGDTDLSADMSEEENVGTDRVTASDGESPVNDTVEEEEEDDENEEGKEEEIVEEEEDEEEEREENEDEEGEEQDEGGQEHEENSKEEDNLEDVDESNEHDGQEGEKVEEIVRKDFDSHENAGHGESEAFSGPEPDSSEANDKVDTSGEDGDETPDQDRSDSAKDLASGGSHNESRPSIPLSPEDLASNGLGSLGDIKPNPDFVIEADHSFLNALSTEAQNSATRTFSDDILAMTLSLRNKVNGRNVLRPTDTTEEDKWEVEYLLEEVPSQSRAKALYEACKLRRQKKLESFSVRDGDDAFVSSYVRKLRDLSMKGRAWRKEVDQKDVEAGKPTSVLRKELVDTR